MAMGAAWLAGVLLRHLQGTLLRSLTGVLLGALAATLTVDAAAPMELAVALPGARVLVRVVPAPAAHQVAPVRATRGAVALATHRPQRARAGVEVAVVGRALQVHQVLAARLPVRPLGALEDEGDRGAGPPAQVGLHQLGLLVSLLQVVADLPKGRQRGPAGLHRARPGHAVALAVGPHAVLHRLKHINKQFQGPGSSTST